jgi:hypothetical protein
VNMTRPVRKFTAAVQRRRVIGALVMVSGIFAMVVFPCATAAPASEYVRTESGRVRCNLEPNQVGCEASGPDSQGFRKRRYRSRNRNVGTSRAREVFTI